jgi:PhnB protein
MARTSTYLNVPRSTEEAFNFHRAVADCLFVALSSGGKVEMPMQEMFWGADFGWFSDRFGIHWMVNCTNQG